MPWQAALALDGFAHRGFFTADICARSAPQMDARLSYQPGCCEAGDLVLQHEAQLGILIPNIEIDVPRLHDPGCDEHAFDETMWIAFEIIPVLERAGLALVGIDRHEARRRLGAYQRPFASGREAGPAEPA